MIANCFARLLQQNVLPGACAARGYLFNNGDVRRVAAAMQYCEKLYALYKSLCVKHTVSKSTILRAGFIVVV